MGKFDGYLICSDLDGTFCCGENSIRINTEAIQYFIKNGGRFTFATGRSTAHLRNSEYFENINAPACICNGGVIYDYKNEKILREERHKFTFGKFLENISSYKDKLVRINVFNSCVEDCMMLQSIDEVTDEMRGWKLIKAVCVFNDTETADEFKAFVKGNDFFNSSYISKSWATGVEFNSCKGTKGQAVNFIKEYLGDIHTTVGVGDFENDLTLLECADIGAAPENAIDSLKNVADIRLKDGEEGAIADLIGKLEEGLK